MIFMIFVKKVKSLFCIILNLFQRCFCCFRRKFSSDESLPVTIEHQHNNSTSFNDNALNNWDSWDGLSSVVSDGDSYNQKGSKLSPLQKQIEEYRLNQQKKISESSGKGEEEPNYFEDLAPKINRKPKIVILARPEEEQQVSNRISLSLSDPVLQGSELLEWTEDSEGGWEEESEQDLNLDAVLREQKEKIRQERKAERLKKKAEKEVNKNNLSKLATKIS